MNKIFLILLFIKICYITKIKSWDCSTDSKTDIERLKSAILCNKDTLNRPQPNPNEATKIFLKYVVSSIEYDEERDQITVNSFLNLKWMDTNLVWNPNDYGNIQKVQVEPNYIWTPDIEMFRRSIDYGYYSCDDVVCFIHFNGTIECNPVCSHVGVCDGNYYNWPFDKQTCDFRLGSWTHTKEEIDFVADSISITQDLQQNDKLWKIYSMNSTYNTSTSHPEVKYIIVIERHITIHTSVFVIPCLIMTILNLTAISLNVSKKERFALLLINIIIHLFCIQEIFWHIPYNGADCPKILIYLRNSFLMTAFLIASTVLLKGLNEYKTSPPQWIDFINNLLMNNSVGLYLVMDDFVDIQKTLNSDNVEEEQQKYENQLKENQKWRQFSKILDRLILILFLLFSIISYFVQMPMGYLNL